MQELEAVNLKWLTINKLEFVWKLERENGKQCEQATWSTGLKKFAHETSALKAIPPILAPFWYGNN